MPGETQVQQWTAEDVETLARFMGWAPLGDDRWWDELAKHAWHGEASKQLRETRGIWSHPYLFTPFTDANADLQVLERVREVWDDQRRWQFACVLHTRWTVRVTETVAYAAVLNLTKYECGDYSVAALAVLP